MKIVLLGDSITAGLGSKKINFEDELRKNIGNNCTISNLALTGTTIDHPLKHIESIINSNPDIIIILYGNVDAQIRPNINGKVFKYLPSRFKKNKGSMILPRPFYSHKFFKRILQRIENLFRTIFRKVIIKIDGTEQWISISEFKDKYELLCKKITNLHKKCICVSTVYIDEKLFKGSSSEYQKYNSVIKEIAQKYSLPYLDLYSLLEEEVKRLSWKKIYNYDHFHPNGIGYKLIAKWISELITKGKIKV